MFTDSNKTRTEKLAFPCHTRVKESLKTTNTKQTVAGFELKRMLREVVKDCCVAKQVRSCPA